MWWAWLIAAAAVLIFLAVVMAALARMASLADQDMPTPDGSVVER